MKKSLVVLVVMFMFALSSCSIFKSSDTGARSRKEVTTSVSASGKKDAATKTSASEKKVRISRPKAVSATADADDNVTIYSNIYNNTDKPVTVTATLSVDGQVATKNYTIPSKQTVRISKKVKITEEKAVRATLTLSTGEKASGNILCKPFF